MISVFVLDIVTVALSNKYAARYTVTAETFDGRFGDDKIHFLNTANSDAILIESNGRFAVIDSGEGNSNPRRKNPYHGFEEYVINYLNGVAADENGKVHLDFALGTHCHYDHIGCFDRIFTDSDITVGTVYLKKYDPSFGKEYEYERWRLGDVYEKIVEDAIDRGFKVVSDLPTEPFMFGDFKITFYNTVTPVSLKGRGENAQSVGVKLEKGGKSAFLAADITSVSGSEQLVEDEVGDVDLLKIGHHGYYGSSSMRFLKKLKPEIAIVTNQLGKIYPNVKWNLIMQAHASVYATYDNDGVTAYFTDDGKIMLTNHTSPA
ncbi:MAG: MBL fold metallo-hydrolase [Clostridiales bacterium]|nr:MBL fold metallo-hydrolase [Clostridiales bacterium]